MEQTLVWLGGQETKDGVPFVPSFAFVPFGVDFDDFAFAEAFDFVGGRLISTFGFGVFKVGRPMTILGTRASV